MRSVLTVTILLSVCVGHLKKQQPLWSKPSHQERRRLLILIYWLTLSGVWIRGMIITSMVAGLPRKHYLGESCVHYLNLSRGYPSTLKEVCVLLVFTWEGTALSFPSLPCLSSNKREMCAMWGVHPISLLNRSHKISLVVYYRYY